MSRRHNEIQDSLDLLLDTMCNAFGGIVLIAILVAILSNEMRVTDKPTRIKELNTEMIKRRIQQAKDDMTDALQRGKELEAELDKPTIGLLAELQQLQSELESLTNAYARSAQSAAASRDAITQPADQRLKDLRNQKANLNREQTSLSNALNSVIGETDRLRSRLTDLQSKERESRSRNVVQLRLPRERPQLKRTFPAILKGDQIFFVYDLAGSALGLNTYGLDFEKNLDGDTRVLPIRGRGVDMRAAARLLSRVPRQDFYIVCWVHGDSFRTFNRFKQLIINSGYEYGWNPMTPDEVLVLTSRDVISPPPL